MPTRSHQKEDEDMAVHIFAQIEIQDADTYRNYEVGFMGVLQKFNGKIVGVDDSPTVLEGDWDFKRAVLLEFDSAEEALAWFESDEYQALAEDRKKASRGTILMFDRLG